MRKEFEEKIEDIKERVRTRKLWISRIPIETRDYFLELAKREFEDDFGMTLKFLCDLHKGYFPTGHEEINARLDMLEVGLMELKETAKPKTRTIRTVGGKVLKIKEKGE